MNKNDPKLYRKLSEPLPAETVAANMEAFCKGVSELREKHSIANVAMIVGAFIAEPDDIRETAATYCTGDQARFTMLAAVLFGSLQETLTEDLTRAVQRGRKNK